MRKSYANLIFFLPVIAAALMASVSRLPLHLGWLVLFAMIPMFYFFDRSRMSALQLLMAAGLYSAFYIPLLLYWITLVTPLGLVGIFFVYSWYFFLVFYITEQVWRYLPRFRYIGFILAMLSLEYIQNYGEMRFPWLNLGYSLADYTILLQVLDVVGTVGLSAIVLTLGCLLYHSIKGGVTRKSYVYMGIVLVIFGMWLGYGWWRLNHLPLQQKDDKIVVMQPSIEQDDKWDAEYFRQILSIYEALTIQAADDSASIVIWPEAAMPTYLMHYPDHRYFVQNLADRLDINIFTGFPDYTRAPESHVNNEYYYNAAALFKPRSEISELYYKIVLVPIGERMLWLDAFPFLWNLQFGQANWEFGTEIRYYRSAGNRFSPSICYEIAFADLNHKMAIGYDYETYAWNKTDYLVNITNDAWFGTSYGPWLHGVLTKFRAIENRIQIYRSANTGISMIVDPLGRVIAKADLFERTNITAPLYVSPVIPMIRKFYMYPIVIVLATVMLFVVATIRKSRINKDLSIQKPISDEAR